MIRFFFNILILFFAFSLVSHAEVQTNATLSQFYDRTQSMQADFEQVISDSRGKVIELSKGELIFSRPNKFIFEYTYPTEQLYISNSKTLWIYDVELEQVSIKPLDSGLGDSPALLLSSNTNVYKHYVVKNISPMSINKKNPLQWVQMSAKNEDSTFERILLGFAQHELRKMKMFDSFGQVTELTFSKLQLNKPFSNRQFDFVVPEGIDVIGSENAQ